MIVKVNKREFNTILAALRYWQREGWRSEGWEHDIADDGGTCKPLQSDEIEELCMRLNMGNDDV